MSELAVRQTPKKIIRNLMIHIILIIGALIFIFPFFWLVSTSLKIDTQIYKFPPVWVPDPIAWENYSNMFKYFPFFKFLKNTLVITILNIGGCLVTAPMVAYGFARINFRGRNFLFAVLLATMMLPGQVTMIPLYILFSKIGLVDTFVPLWIGSWFGGGAFNIFLIRQFFMTIPKELEESAVIDGASRLTIYHEIMLPLIKPVLTTIAIFSFMGSWNDFMGPLIYINDQAKYTLSLGLRLFQQQSSGLSQYGMMMAATTIMTLPVIIFFFLGQKKFIEGVVLTGIKG